MKLFIASGLVALSLLTACDSKEPESQVSSSQERDTGAIGLGGLADSESQPQGADLPEQPVPSNPQTKTPEPAVPPEQSQPDRVAQNGVDGDWGGIWDTTYGEMRLKQFPPVTVDSGEAPPIKVTGTYDTDQGQIDAFIYDGSLYGLWAETNSAQKCDTPRLGSDYWGGIAYQKVDANTFKGIWTYCTELGPGSEALETDTSSWDGTRISPVGSQPIRDEGNESDGDLNSSKIGFRGVWDTSEGEMQLAWADHVTITGTYSQDGGRIVGNVEGNLKELNGYWIENGSAQRCDTPQQGSYHWGRVQFILNEDESEFQGTWGYCNAEPESAWTGKRTS